MNLSCPASPSAHTERAGARSPHGRQRGQGAVEFLLAAVPVLLAGLGGIEAVHWYFVRQAVSLALAQAGRAAITQHAHPGVLEQAFMQALLPLHAGPTPGVSQARLHRAMARREFSTGLPAWQLRIVSPSAAAFSDFASQDPDLPRHGQPAIDNDYLHERHQARLAQGWPEGRGPLSGQTTFEANTLVLQLTWLHQPLLPGVRHLLKQLAPTDARYGSRAMARAGYLPMHRRLSFVMQSHPVAWDMPAHGRIIRAAGKQSGPEADPGGAGHPAQAAIGEHPAGNDVPYGPIPAEDAAGPTGETAPASAPPAGAAPQGNSLPHACTGLWCLEGVSRWPPHGGERVQEPGSGPVTDAGAPAAPGSGTGDGYLEAGTDPDWPPAPAELEDCPGCCA